MQVTCHRERVNVCVCVCVCLFARIICNLICSAPSQPYMVDPYCTAVNIYTIYKRMIQAKDMKEEYKPWN